MKVKKVIKTLVRWDCGDSRHSHTTEVIAQNCYDKRMRKSALPDYTIRNINMCKDILNGFSYVDVAKKNSLSSSRVRSIFLKKMFRLTRGVKEWFFNGRYVNALRLNKDALIEMLEED